MPPFLENYATNSKGANSSLIGTIVKFAIKTKLVVTGGNEECGKLNQDFLQEAC